MIIFYSSIEQSEVRAYCRTEGVSYTDLLEETNKSEKENWKKKFKWILSIIRIGRKNNNSGGIDINEVLLLKDYM